MNLYPALHGSALFQRGQTQVLCTLAFDAWRQSATGARGDPAFTAAADKPFILHYDFPSYAVNEVSTGR
jgi:polyribonucleotide nucleotidyltransferase